MARRQPTRHWTDDAYTLRRREQPRRWTTGRILLALLAALAVLYTAALFGWVIVHALIGDGMWWSFLLNTFALYLFIPLAALVPLALLLRSYLLRAGALAGTVLFLLFYGNLFVPHALRPAPPAGAPRLTAMTFNVLVTNVDPDGVAAAIRRSGADLVGLQEVSPAVAEALRRDLSNLYPYQILGDATGSSRLALLSRYPLHNTGIMLPGEWNDVPLVARMRFASADVTVIVAHPVSTLLTRERIRQEIQQRDYTAHTLADFVRSQKDPVVVLSDFNAGDQSTPYKVVTSVLGDAWREGGFGFGHTFPGADSFGSSRPRIQGWLVPPWLIRIDYVFHSRQWRTVDAHIGPWDGVSDHRPVLATLALVDRS